MNLPPSFFAALASLDPNASVVVGFCDLDLSTTDKWQAVADEYAPDTVHDYTYESLVFALPLPQFGCLIEEGPFKKACEEMEARGEWSAEFEKPCWIFPGFEWEGARCGAVAIEFE